MAKKRVKREYSFADSARMKPQSILWMMFIFFCGLGIELFSPTALSFVARWKIERRVESCVEEIENLRDIRTIHKIISQYGLQLRKRKTSKDVVIEEFTIPLFVLESWSDEDYFLEISITGDSLVKRAVWNRHSYPVEMDLFSEPSKTLRNSINRRTFFSILTYLGIYQMAVVFILVVTPRIVSPKKRKFFGKNTVGEVILIILLIIVFLALLISALMLLYLGSVSLHLLPDQIAFLSS